MVERYPYKVDVGGSNPSAPILLSLLMMNKNNNPLILEKGGYLLEVENHLVQIGCPPETIKDSIIKKKEVPAIFILTEGNFLCENSFKSLMEIEFPIYYNFFLLKKKISVICPKKYKSALEKTLTYCLSLKKKYDIAKDFASLKKDYFPPSKQEYSYFVNYKLKDVIEIISYDDKNNTINNFPFKVTIKKENIIINSKKKKIDIANTIHYNPYSDLYKKNSSFKNSSFISLKNQKEILCLGASDGFDELDKTSGFLFFFNGKIALIDPPCDSYFWLIKNGIDPSLVDSIILTHVHADHDSGILKFINADHKVNFYTTSSILNSWLDKYSLVTGKTKSNLKNLFNFKEIKIGKKTKIIEESFFFHYSMHSIPTLGLYFYYKDQKGKKKMFFYSGDHLNSSEHYEKLLRGSYISKMRYKELMGFPWQKADIIFHECGVEPLHTGLGTFLKQPKSIQKKVHLYHTSKKKYLELKKKYNHSIQRLVSGGTTILNNKKSTFNFEEIIPNFINIVGLEKEFKKQVLKQKKKSIKKQNFKPFQDEQFYYLSEGFIVEKRDKKEALYRRGNWIQFDKKSEYTSINDSAVIQKFDDTFHDDLKPYFDYFAKNQSENFIDFLKGNMQGSYTENYIFDFAMVFDFESKFDPKKIKNDKKKYYIFSKDYLTQKKGTKEILGKGISHIKIIDSPVNIDGFFSVEKSFLSKYASFCPIVNFKFFEAKVKSV